MVEKNTLKALLVQRLRLPDVFKNSFRTQVKNIALQVLYIEPIEFRKLFRVPTDVKALIKILQY